MRQRNSGRSRSRSLLKAIAWLCLSALSCGASLSWILKVLSTQTIASAASHSLGTPPDIAPYLLAGGMGLLVAVGLGITGLLYWPSTHSVPFYKGDATLSTYDSVTGLPSRRLILVLLQQALARARTTGRGVAILVVGPDEFRPVPTSSTLPNMTLVVRVQAARIKSVVQSHDAVARIDERTFALIVDNLESPKSASVIAEKIQSTMSLPLLIEGQEVLLSCRVGCAIAPQDGSDAESLLDAAVRLLSHRQASDDSILFLSDPATMSSTSGNTSGHVTQVADPASGPLTASR